MVSILLVESATRKLVSAKACFISAPSVQEPIKSARVRGAQVEHDRQVVERIVLKGLTHVLRVRSQKDVVLQGEVGERADRFPL